jgi:hypothetical protein
MNTLAGATVTFVVSLLTSATVTPPVGAGDDSVTAKGAEAPGANTVPWGRVMVPDETTVTEAVAFVILGEPAEAVTVAVPPETPVTGTVAVVEPEAIVTVVGTLTIPAGEALIFTVMAEGAGADSVSVRF